MTKSFSKKILIFLLVALSTLGLAFSTATALAVAPTGFENTYDDQTEYAKQENLDRQSALVEGIEEYKGLLEGKVEVDPDGESLNYVLETLEYDRLYGESENYIAEKYLYGNTGLNGIYGIYDSAYKFYNRYVLTVDGYTEIATQEGFARHINDSLLKDAKDFLVNFKAKNYENDFDKSKVDGLILNFETEKVESAKQLNNERKEGLESYNAQIDYYARLYYSDKYGGDYTSETVPQTTAEEYKQSIEKKFFEATTYETAKTTAEGLVKEYKELFKNLKTVFERSYEEILADVESSTQELMAKCENAFETLLSLGTIEHYEKDGEGNPFICDLKTLDRVGNESSVLSGDLKIAKDLLATYKNLTKRRINEIKVENSKQYGVTALGVVSNNVMYAESIADCLSDYGKLVEDGTIDAGYNGYSAGQYYYVVGGTKNFVVNGTDIANAYFDSFTISGAIALRKDGGLIQSQIPPKNISTITYVDDSEEPKFEISLTCLDENGNEVYCFDTKAELRVRTGATPAVERNINLLLNGNNLSEKSKNITNSERRAIEDKILYYYLTLTVYEPVKAGGDLAVKEDIKEGYTFKVKVTFNSEEELKILKEKTGVIKYHHTTIENVYNDITWGDNYMIFNVTNFVNAAQFAVVGEGNFKDIAKWIVLGLVGLIALFFLVWIIIIALKNRKYKISFLAGGGRFNSHIRVKLHQRFNHPAAPRRKGYKFLGWYLDRKGTKKFAATELTKRRDIKVYAKWISLKEYEKLNEKYNAEPTPLTITTVSSKPTVPAVVEEQPEVVSTPAVAPTNITIVEPAEPKKDPQIEKIEAEKLSYIAKTAEEERKTEEIKLQAIREIEEAKKNEEAREQAKRDIADAREEVERVYSDKEEIVADAKAEERVKVVEEMNAVNTAITTPEKSEEEYAKEKAEAVAAAEARVRKEYEDKAQQISEEQAKINAKFEDEITALKEANAKAQEEAKAKAEAEAKAREDAETQRIIAEAEQRANAEAEARRLAEEKAREEIAQAQKAKEEAEQRANAEAEARRLAEEKANAEAEARKLAEDQANAEAEARKLAEDQANADAEARRIAEAEAKAQEEVDNEKRINEAIAAGIAARLAELKTQEETAIVEEPIEEVANEEPIEEETTPAFDTEKVFDVLKSEIYSYTDADDLGYGLEENVPACAMKVVGETIELEVNLDLGDCAKKGYNVVEGSILPVKTVIASDDDIAEANELIEETMFVNGLRKTQKAVITASTPETRANGFEYGISKDKIVDTPEEFYKYIRVYAQSFVLADETEVTEKALIKMFLARGRVYAYFNYESEELNACDEEIASEGFKTFMTIKTVDECKTAIEIIGKMMKENGLIRYPSEIKISGDESTKGFTYILKK